MKNLLKKCHTIIITLGRYSFNIYLFIFFMKYFFIFTLGEKGAAVATRENSTPSWVKAEKVDKVVDTTGAGRN